MRTCSLWANRTARITVRTAAHRRRPAQAIMSRAPLRTARPVRAPVARTMPGSGGPGDSAPGHLCSLRAPGRPVRIRFITDLPRVIDRARPVLLGIRGPNSSGKIPGIPTAGLQRSVAVWSAGRCTAQRSADPFRVAAAAGVRRPARFDVGRAMRQYDAVEPENRLVARTLEHALEDKLTTLRRAEHDLAAQKTRRPVAL